MQSMYPFAWWVRWDYCGCSVGERLNSRELAQPDSSPNWARPSQLHRWLARQYLQALPGTDGTYTSTPSAESFLSVFGCEASSNRRRKPHTEHIQCHTTLRTRTADLPWSTSAKRRGADWKQSWKSGDGCGSERSSRAELSGRFGLDDAPNHDRDRCHWITEGGRLLSGSWIDGLSKPPSFGEEPCYV